MQLDLFSAFQRPRPPVPQTVQIGRDQVPVQFIRNPRARRYVLRVGREGTIRVTIPRGGSITYGIDFLRKNTTWLARQWQRRQLERAERATGWGEGAEILFRGQLVRLTVHSQDGVKVVQLGDHSLTVPPDTADLRPAVECYLWGLAAKELPPLTFQAASRHGLPVTRVIVRNQRSRWGSCSPRGTISLNWRLIQAPPFVRDYLIVHELMHLRQMNHSPRYWAHVAAACPDFAQAEEWLNRHARLLR